MSDLIPKVSVIMPCYNQGQYLEEAVQSVIEQSYPHWECIIVDDGSIDNTSEIVKKICNKESRIKYIYQINQGPSVARNVGIANSTGAYILPLDGDDKITRDYLEKAVVVLKNDEQIKIVYANAEKFGEEEGPWNLGAFSFKEFLLNNCIYCSGLFRRSDFDNTQGYNPNMRDGLEDWDFWISLLSKGGEVHKIQDVCFYYRITKTSRTRSLDKIKQASLRKQIYDNHSEIYVREFGDPIQVYKENLQLKKCIEEILLSTSYRVGHSVIRPAAQIKTILQKVLFNFHHDMPQK